MAGCYGNAAEDRMAEAELDRWLESGFGEEEIEARAEDLMAQAISTKFCEQLDRDYELLTNRIPEIIEITADAARDIRTGQATPDARFSALGRAIDAIVREELRRVAEHQISAEF